MDSLGASTIWSTAALTNLPFCLITSGTEKSMSSQEFGSIQTAYGHHYIVFLPDRKCAKYISCQAERVQICQSQRNHSQRLCTLKSNYAPRARNRPNDRPLSQGFTRRDSIASLSQSIPMPGVDGATAFPLLTSISDRVTMRSCGMYST
jgi:hypothetical protein